MWERHKYFPSLEKLIAQLLLISCRKNSSTKTWTTSLTLWLSARCLSGSKILCKHLKGHCFILGPGKWWNLKKIAQEKIPFLPSYCCIVSLNVANLALALWRSLSSFKENIRGVMMSYVINLWDRFVSGEGYWYQPTSRLLLSVKGKNPNCMQGSREGRH